MTFEKGESGIIRFTRSVRPYVVMVSAFLIGLAKKLYLLASGLLELSLKWFSKITRNKYPRASNWLATASNPTYRPIVLGAVAGIAVLVCLAFLFSPFNRKKPETMKANRIPSTTAEGKRRATDAPVVEKEKEAGEDSSATVKNPRNEAAKQSGIAPRTGVFRYERPRWTPEREREARRNMVELNMRNGYSREAAEKLADQGMPFVRGAFDAAAAREESVARERWERGQ